MSLRKTGIDIIGDVPWGIHLCQFYQTKEDLTDILIPYFKTGLENNEFCLWVTSDILDEQEALQVLREAVPDFGQYLEKGQIGIVPHTEWYLKYKSFGPQMILNGGLKEIDQVLASGYDGIRVAGNAAWLAKKDCKSLNDHQKVAGNGRGQYPIMVICAYLLDKCGASEAIDVVKNHHLSLIKQGDQWQVVGSSVHESERIDRTPPGSEQEYRHLFESTLDGMEVIDAETGKVALANQAAARMFGFDSPRKLIGLNPLEYIPVEDRERVAGMMAEHMFEKDLHQVMELRALTKDGREIWISAIGVRTEYQGRLAGIVSIRDITVQKLAEKALLDSKEELQAIFDGVKEGIAILDKNGRVVRVNSRVLQVGEYPEKDIIGKAFNRLQMLPPESIAQTLSVQAEILSGQKVPPFESKVYSGSGKELDLEIQVTPLKQREELVGSIVVLRDITERKQSEEKLRASEEENRLLVENANEGIAIVQDGVLTFANHKLADFVSYPLEEVINKPFDEFVHPDDRQMVTEHYVNRLKGEEVPHIYQFRVIDKSGNTRWAEINAVLFSWKGSPAVLCFLNDVTERKQADEVLQESERRYRLLAENASDVIWTMDMELRPTYVSPSIIHMLGYSVDEAMARKVEQSLTPASLEIALKALSEGLSIADTNTEDLCRSRTMELEMICKNGSTIWTEVEASFLRNSDGQPSGIMVMARDITERKRAEGALQASEQRFRTVYERSPVGIMVYDPEGQITNMNKVALDIFGLSSISEAKAPSLFEDPILPDQAKHLLRTGKTLRYEGAVDFGQAKEHGLYNTNRSGIAYLQIMMTALGNIEEGSIDGYLIQAQDITERKRSEEALQESEKRYRLLASNISDVIWVTDMKLQPIYLSPSITRLLGYSVEEAMAGSLETMLPHDSLQKATESFAEATATEKKESGEAAGPRTLELEFKRKDGSTVWLNTTVSFIRGADGQPVEILGVLRDVTERRKAEKALRESEERLRHLIETTSDWVWEIDGKGTYTYVSPRIIEILGYEPEEVLGKTPFDLMPLHEANRMTKLIGSAIASGKSFTFIENTNLHKDGHPVVVETSGVPFLDEDGVVRGYRGIARDISERKQAEEQLHQSFYNLEKTLEGTIQAITLMVETRDRYTAGHQQRVTQLACAIAREMGLSSKQIQTIRIAGLLHDLGKIFIPTEILSKPGRLTDIEFAIIKTHPKAGYDILKNIDFPWPIADIVVQHHERIDGSGYPSGLQGEEITLEARILAVADIVEAMSSHRPYRPSLGLDRALKEVIDNKGVFYDPDVVDACLRVFVEKRFKLGEELATSSVG